MKMKYLLLTTLLVSTMACVAFADVIVIANADIKETTYDANNLKKIFLGKKSKWMDGKKIKLVVAEKTPFHKEFLRTYIKKSPQQFTMFWKKALFTGTGIPPTKVTSGEEMISIVGENEGAVGYIDSETVIKSKKVKILEPKKN